MVVLKPAAWGCENYEKAKAWVQVVILYFSFTASNSLYKNKIKKWRDGGVGWGGWGGGVLLKPATWDCENGEKTKAWVQVVFFFFFFFTYCLKFPLEVKKAGGGGGGGGGRCVWGGGTRSVGL